MYSRKRKMRIDAHQHFWRYDAAEYGWITGRNGAAEARIFSPATCSRCWAESRFDGSIAVQARHSMDETRWLLELAEAQ